MTTVQAQAARTRAFVLVAAWSLLGCAASPSSVYRVEGATTDFCVPATVDVTPHRPDQGAVVKGGFAMNGCWRSGQGTCVGPGNLVVLSVTDKGSFLGRSFADFPGDAHVGMTANQRRENAKSLGDSLIAIPDGAAAGKWFVWSVQKSNGIAMSDGDKLEVTCVEKASTGGYLCDRKVAEHDYLLGYSFVSAKLPATFNALDRQVAAEIETFRCPITLERE